MKYTADTDELPARASGPAPVTIIIPAYNAADTVACAVRSALAQTLEGVEIYVVDDCSTDNTWEVVQVLWHQYARLRASRLKENRGRAYVGNFAAERATGKWIAILDADDWYSPERLERIITAAEAAGTEMGSDNQYLIDPGLQTIVGTAFPSIGRQRTLDLDSFLAGSDATKNFDYGMLKPVFLREFLLRHELEYYVPARRGQDYYMNLCFFAAGGRATVLDEPLYYYVQPFGRVSRQWSTVTRKRYPFELMLQTNGHFYNKFYQRFSPRQRRRLAARSRQFRQLAIIDRLREAFRDRNYRRVLALSAGGFPGVWLMATKLGLRSKYSHLLKKPASAPPSFRPPATLSFDQLDRSVGSIDRS